MEGITPSPAWLQPPAPRGSPVPSPGCLRLVTRCPHCSAFRGCIHSYAGMWAALDVRCFEPLLRCVQRTSGAAGKEMSCCVCVSLTLVTGSDISGAGGWLREGPSTDGTIPAEGHGEQGCVARISLAMNGTSHPLMPARAHSSWQKDKVLLERSQGPPCLWSPGRHSQAGCPVPWLAAGAAGMPCQKGHSLRAIPVLPCWMLQGAGTLLRGIFLPSLQKECSCRS